jgi:hypothetical protein
MFSLLKHVLRECKSLILKMDEDAPKSKLIWKNLDILCDMKLIFGLPCWKWHTHLLSLLKGVIFFIYDFIDVVKLVEVKLYQSYVEA